MEEFENRDCYIKQDNEYASYQVEQPDNQEYPARLPDHLNHLTAGIVLTAIFGVLGLPVLINACKACLRWNRKNYELATQAARKSGRWIAPVIILGVLIYVAFIALYIYEIYETSNAISEINYYY